MYWLLCLIVVTVVRVLMTGQLKRRLGETQVRVTGFVYTLSALVAGIVWASIVLFDNTSHPIGARLMILITLVGMPVASLSSNAIYRPVYAAFSAPIFAALFGWAWWYLP